MDDVIGAVVEVALTRLISIIEGGINYQLSLKDKLRKLRTSLTLAHAFLQDAETRQVHDKPVQLWLKHLGGIASKANDVLDEIVYEDLRSKAKTQFGKQVSDFFSRNPLVLSTQMIETVEGINTSLNDLNVQANSFGLQQRVQANPHQTTPSSGDSSYVVGREDDVQKIIDLLIGSSTRSRCAFSITSIVGMGGLGKTTLAESVYNNRRTQKYFNRRRKWICVSKNFDVGRILQEMFESLIRETCNLKNRSAMLEKIQKELEGKTYLLALDDVQDEDVRTLEGFMGSLLRINNNIRISILITTRNENVAVVGDAPQVGDTPQETKHRLMSLRDDECWAIIKRRAFKKYSIFQELEDIGRDIASKCRGVPLVANVIGGIMRNKWDINEWVPFRDGSHWDFLEKHEGVIDVLRSFDRLPSSLKQCLVYCSIFPKNFSIQKDQLIQLWMAEGFLQQAAKGNSHLAFGDIGNKYFHDLLSNSLLQVVEKDLYGSITSCKMHDFIHDLAQSIRNLEIGNTSRNQPQNAFDDVKLWHSLFLKSSSFQDEVSFKCLRVLKICNAKIDSLPESICMLIHLRYFDVSDTDICRLPECIAELYHLHTLRLLRCRFLGKLPHGVNNLVKLRHLYITFERHVPNKIGCLTNLQTLPIFDVGREERRGIGELGHLTELGGELVIGNLQNIRDKEEAERAKLQEKKELHKLTYQWEFGRKDRNNNDEEVLEGLKPHSNLKSLTIKHYNGKNLMPSWMVGENVPTLDLVELNLLYCEKLNTLPTLGHYPNLKFLEIKGLKNVKCLGNEFYVLFPALEKFTLFEMDELEEWLDTEPASKNFTLSDIEELEEWLDVFPSLKELRIEECGKLSNVPAMKRFSSLQILTIRDCKELKNLRDDGFFPSTLKKLEIVRCGRLSSISLNPRSESLLELELKMCDELRSIPTGLGRCTSLQKLEISNCNNLESIPEDIGQLNSLRVLCIWRCRNLKWFPEESIGNLTGLKTLALGAFSEELEEFPGLSSIHRFHSSLEDLILFGWKKLSTLPVQLQLLTSLGRLSIQEFSGVTALPEWLGNMYSLRELSIRRCENLGHLPSEEAMKRLSNLQKLSITKCLPLKENNTELSKISHVPTICIDDYMNFWLPALEIERVGTS